MNTTSPENRRAKYAKERNSPPACTIDETSMTIRFFDRANFIKGCRELRRSMKMTFYAESEKVPGSS